NSATPGAGRALVWRADRRQRTCWRPMPESAGEGTAVPGHVSVLDLYFDLGRSGTEPRTEIVAGVTTFLTMAYIVFVNPQILGTTGMDKGAVFVATCIAAAVSTLMMALYANYPI